MFDQVLAQLSALVRSKDSQQNAAVIRQLSELSSAERPLAINILCPETTAINTILECLVAPASAKQIMSAFDTNLNQKMAISGGILTYLNSQYPLLESVSDMPGTEILFASASRLNALSLVEYNQVHAHSIMGLVAAPGNYSFSDVDLGAFNLFSDAIKCMGFWVTPDLQTTGATNWLQTPINANLKTLQAIRIQPGAPIAEYLADTDNSIREYVQQSNMMNQTKQMLEAVQGAYAGDEQHLMSGFTLAGFEFNEVKISKSPEKQTKSYQKRLDKFTSELKQSVKRAKRLSKEKLIGRGLYFQLLEAELASIDKDSIEEEKQHKNHQLSLKPHVFEVLQDTLWTQISNEVKQENKVFQQNFAQAMQTLSGVNYLTESTRAEIQDDIKDNDHIHGLREHMDIKPRYSGERPVRGIFKRLGEGRKAVFMVLMSLSIFGTMAGFNYRDYAFVGFIFLFIFIFSFIYTFFSWRKEDQLLLEKEVDKLRDQLHTDFQRAINEISRDNLKELEDRVSDVREQITKLNTDYAKQTGESQKDALEDAKSHYADKQEILKNLLNESRDRNEKLAAIMKEFTTKAADINDLIPAEFN